jgi:3-phenylpropionate/trans-cinnamate dioxygenase ferredoxin subunit
MPTPIKVRFNGPYLVDLTQGGIELTDHEGNPIPLPAGKTNVALCRCGASVTKPFCDGTHSRIGFNAAEAAQRLVDRTGSTAPPRG